MPMCTWLWDDTRETGFRSLLWKNNICWQPQMCKWWTQCFSVLSGLQQPFLFCFTPRRVQHVLEGEVWICYAARVLPSQCHFPICLAQQCYRLSWSMCAVISQIILHSDTVSLNNTLVQCLPCSIMFSKETRLQFELVYILSSGQENE